MRNILHILVYALAAVLIAGCDGTIDSEYKEQLVVTGFIYPGEPIDSVVLRYTFPYGTSYDDSTYAVDGADVRIRVDGTEYQLLPSTARGRYYLPAAEHIVEGGKEYQLFVTKDEHSLYSRTRVPMPIQFTNLDTAFPPDRNLVLDWQDKANFSYTIKAGPRDDPKRIYMIMTTSLDSTADRIPREEPTDEEEEQNQFGDSTVRTRWGFLQTAPNYILYSNLFRFYGEHRLTALSLDSNWVDYKRAIGYGRQSFLPFQTSLNHVKGGIGVWASAARDTVTVYIKEKQ